MNEIKLTILVMMLVQIILTAIVIHSQVAIENLKANVQKRELSERQQMPNVSAPFGDLKPYRL